MRSLLVLIALAIAPSVALAQADQGRDTEPEPGEFPAQVSDAPSAAPSETTGLIEDPGEAPPPDLVEEQRRLEREAGDDAPPPITEESERSYADPYEDPDKKYYLLGAFYRHTWTPAFILNLFTEDASGGDNAGVGLQFTYRKDGLSVVTDVYYQRFAIEGPFRGLNDPIEEIEIIKSTLSTIMVGVSFIWSTNFTNWLALEYGLGLGLGVVLGDLNRHEARPDGDGYTRCEGPSTPDPRFCDATSVPDGEEGGHYNVNARKWTDGGSLPNVWMRLAPQIGLRFKPIRQVQIRVGGGFDVFSGFFAEGSVAFGF